MPSPPLPPFPHLPPPLTGAPAGVPVGSVVAFAGAADKNSAGAARLAAQGWMVCDGTLLSTTQYNELFNVIGYDWSATQSGDTFNLPDMRGYFLRGVDEGSGHDPDLGSRTPNSKVGSLQPCALQVHEHDYEEVAITPAPGGDVAGVASLVTQSSLPTSSVTPASVTSQKETRPVNVYVYYLIKFTSQVFPQVLPQGQRVVF